MLTTSSTPDMLVNMDIATSWLRVGKWKQHVFLYFWHRKTRATVDMMVQLHSYNLLQPMSYYCWCLQQLQASSIHWDESNISDQWTVVIITDILHIEIYTCYSHTLIGWQIHVHLCTYLLKSRPVIQHTEISSRYCKTSHRNQVSNTNWGLGHLF